MKTKYNVGDEVVITLKVSSIRVNENGVFYELDSTIIVPENELIAKTTEKADTIVEKLKASE